jgi:hypothetical protein
MDDDSVQVACVACHGPAKCCFSPHHDHAWCGALECANAIRDIIVAITPDATFSDDDASLVSVYSYIEHLARDREYRKVSWRKRRKRLKEKRCAST